MPAAKPVPSSSSPTRAIVVAAPSPDRDEADIARSLAELEQLVLGLGIAVEHTTVQRRGPRAAPAYLGEGKLREVAALTGGSGEVARGPAASKPPPLREDLVVVADDELTPGQIRQLSSALGVEVVDRTAIILRVFAARARTREAQLEIELARLGYELPRFRDDGEAATAREAAVAQHVATRTSSSPSSGCAIASRRCDARSRSPRARRTASESCGDDVFRVALVGYTNAGKSSLMRALTGSEVPGRGQAVRDARHDRAPAATRPRTPPAVVIDTVGFIHRLPHPLVASFHSTLAEARGASLLVHVVDAADSEIERQRTVTEEVLADLGAKDTPSLFVLNKADRLAPERREALATRYPDALLVSALDATDVARVHAAITAKLDDGLVERAFTIPHDRTGVVAQLRDRLRVVDEEWGDEVRLTVRRQAGGARPAGSAAGRIACADDEARRLGPGLGRRAPHSARFLKKSATSAKRLPR